MIEKPTAAFCATPYLVPEVGGPLMLLELQGPFHDLALLRLEDTLIFRTLKKMPEVLILRQNILFNQC